MKEQLIHILKYDYWANKKLLEYVDSFPEDIFHKQMSSVFPTLAETFYHIFRGKRIWIKRSIPTIEVDESITAFKDVEQAEKCMTELHQIMVDGINRYYDDLDVIVYQTMKGTSPQYRFNDIIYHLVNHGSYHRGNIASMIRESGYKGTSTDYIVYIRDID